ncbi:MAG: diguanylate cyclase, partial [Actinomycetota bacterium]
RGATPGADTGFMDANPEIDRLIAIIEVQNEIAATRLDLDSVLDLVARRALQLTSATGATLELLDGEELVYRAGAGSAEEHVGMRVSSARGLPAICLKSGETVRCDNTSEDERADPELYALLDAKSLVCVPLVHEEDIVGVLTAVASRTSAFHEGDVQTLRLLSGLVAASLTHAGRFASTDEETRHDALTDLGNRRAYEDRLAIEVARSARYGHPLSLIILDVDGFRAVNDQYGYLEGDSALSRIASLIRQTRTADDCFRIAGDEFAVLMPNTSKDGAELAATRLRNLIAAADLCDGLISIVFGVAECSGDEPMAFHTDAYDSLYEAKLARKTGQEVERAS